MFRTRTAGSAPAVESGGQSYRQRGAFSRGSGAVMGTLARVVRLIVSIIVLIIVAGIVLVLLKANPIQSNGFTLSSRRFGIQRNDNAMPMIPSGTLR